jgi:hypothetical protein
VVVAGVLHDTTDPLFNDASRQKDTANYTVPGFAVTAKFALMMTSIPLVTLQVELFETIEDNELITLPDLNSVLCNEMNITRSQLLEYLTWALSADEQPNSNTVLTQMDQILDEPHNVDKIVNDYKSHIYVSEEKFESNKIVEKVANEVMRWKKRFKRRAPCSDQIGEERDVQLM